MDSFLLIGQSNMAGRGKIGEVDAISDSRIKMLRNGRWIDMCEPIHYDRPFAGIGLSASFAKLYADEYNKEVGLIACADGGSSLDDWAVDGILFKNAINMSKLAMITGDIKGILWHQGEGDWTDELYPLYTEKFLKIAQQFRQELNLNDAPFLMGGLGEYLAECKLSENGKNYCHINSQFADISKKYKNFYYVTAKGLTPNNDYLHFNAASLRIFGKRYFEVYKTRKSLYEPFDDSIAVNYNKSDDDVICEDLLTEYKNGRITKDEYDIKLREYIKTL